MAGPGQDDAGGLVDAHALRPLRLHGLDLLARAHHDVAVLYRALRREHAAAERHRLRGRRAERQLAPRLLHDARRLDLVGDAGLEELFESIFGHAAPGS